MSGFTRIFDETLGHEGGYTVDHAGPTNYGITQKTYDAYRIKNKKSINDVKNIDVGEAKKIAEEEYFIRPKFDKLSDSLAEIMFDYGFNASPKRATKALQKAVGSKDDGVIGPKTLKATEEYIKTHGEKQLLQNVVNEREKHMKKLIEDKPDTYKKYENGWKNRIKTIKEKFDLSKLNPFGSDAYAAEIPEEQNRRNEMQNTSRIRFAQEDAPSFSGGEQSATQPMVDESMSVDTPSRNIKFADTRSSGTTMSFDDDKQEAWRIQTPEALVESGMPWQLAGMVATGQQLSKPLWTFGNSYLFGLPNVALDKMGMKTPKTEIKIGLGPEAKDISRPVEILSDLFGFIRGPVKAVGGAASKLPVSGIAGGALKGAVGFGGAMGLSTDDPEQFGNLKRRMVKTGIGATIGAVSGAVGGYFKDFGKTAQLKSGTSIRNSFKSTRNKLHNWYEKRLYTLTLKHKGIKADMSPAVDKFVSQVGDSKKLQSLYNASPKLQKLIENPEGLSLRQTQDLVNQLKSTVSETKLAGFKIRPSDREVLGLINTVQNIKRTTFKGMGNVDATYGRVTETLKTVEPIMKKGRTISGLKGVFNNVEKEAALRRVLPKETFIQAKNIVTFGKLDSKAVKFVGNLIQYGIFYKLISDSLQNAAKSLDPSGSVSTEN